MTQIFDPKNCNKYLENKICRYHAKRLDEQGLEYLDADKMRFSVEKKTI